MEAGRDAHVGCRTPGLCYPGRQPTGHLTGRAGSFQISGDSTEAFPLSRLLSSRVIKRGAGSSPPVLCLIALSRRNCRVSRGHLWILPRGETTALPKIATKAVWPSLSRCCRQDRAERPRGGAVGSPVGTTPCPRLPIFMLFRIQRGGYSP